MTAAVIVTVVADPAGRPAVLLQLEQGWMTLAPDEARRLAQLLTLSAETAGAIREEQERQR